MKKIKNHTYSIQKFIHEWWCNKINELKCLPRQGNNHDSGSVLNQGQAAVQICLGHRAPQLSKSSTTQQKKKYQIKQQKNRQILA